MQILILIAIVLSVVIAVSLYRQNRDQNELAARVREQGGEVIRLRRARKGHPFPDTGRGWWAWQVEWRSGSNPRTSWALTTREGIKEWRD